MVNKFALLVSVASLCVNMDPTFADRLSIVDREDRGGIKIQRKKMINVDRALYRQKLKQIKHESRVAKGLNRQQKRQMIQEKRAERIHAHQLRRQMIQEKRAERIHANQLRRQMIQEKKAVRASQRQAAKVAQRKHILEIAQLRKKQLIQKRMAPSDQKNFVTRMKIRVPGSPPLKSVASEIATLVNSKVNQNLEKKENQVYPGMATEIASLVSTKITQNLQEKEKTDHPIGSSEMVSLVSDKVVQQLLEKEKAIPSPIHAKNLAITGKILEEMSYFNEMLRNISKEVYSKLKDVQEEIFSLSGTVNYLIENIVASRINSEEEIDDESSVIKVEDPIIKTPRKTSIQVPYLDAESIKKELKTIEENLEVAQKNFEKFDINKTLGKYTFGASPASDLKELVEKKNILVGITEKGVESQNKLSLLENELKILEPEDQERQTKKLQNLKEVANNLNLEAIMAISFLYTLSEYVQTPRSDSHEEKMFDSSLHSSKFDQGHIERSLSMIEVEVKDLLDGIEILNKGNFNTLDKKKTIENLLEKATDLDNRLFYCSHYCEHYKTLFSATDIENHKKEISVLKSNIELNTKKLVKILTQELKSPRSASPRNGDVLNATSSTEKSSAPLSARRLNAGSMVSPRVAKSPRGDLKIPKINIEKIPQIHISVEPQGSPFDPRTDRTELAKILPKLIQNNDKINDLSGENVQDILNFRMAASSLIRALDESPSLQREPKENMIEDLKKIKSMLSVEKHNRVLFEGSQKLVDIKLSAVLSLGNKLLKSIEGNLERGADKK